MDIRLSYKFFSHIKTKRLAKRFGDGAVLGLIKLWTYAAEHFPKGDISELSNDEIAMIAEIDVDADKFVETLIELRFIDIYDGGLKKLHEWKEHQPYAYYAEERSRIAKQNIEKRWRQKHKDDEQDENDEKSDIIKRLRDYGIDDERLQKLTTKQLDRLLYLVEENRIDIRLISDVYAYARSLDEPAGYITFSKRRANEVAAQKKHRIEIPHEKIDENDIQKLMQLLDKKNA